MKNLFFLLLALLALATHSMQADENSLEAECLALAQEYTARGDTAKARICYQHALALNADNQTARQALGDSAAQTGLVQQKTPKKTDIQEVFSQAYQYYTEGKEVEAIACYEAVLAINPNVQQALLGIAYLLKNRGEFSRALPHYNKLLELNPAHSDAHQGRSHVLLALGKCEQAWQDFEHRWSKPRPDAKNFTAYMHMHNNNLAGKTVLIKSEFGFGDTLQFIRYAEQLKTCGARVIAQVQKQLIPLISLCPYLDLVIPVDSNAPAHDLETVLMSLPWACNTTLETIPAHTPYLYADTHLTQQWKERLARDTNFKIGICWHGNAYTTQNLKKLVDAKSIPLKLLAPLAKLEGVSLYCLQKTSGLDELATVPHDCQINTFDDASFDAGHGAFMDTAAVMKNLDLIITIDTSIAHLAGGLGAPTWLLLSRGADWRWLIDRENSPWYPTMRLFRQPTMDDWESVVRIVTKELKTLLAQKQQACMHSAISAAEKTSTRATRQEPSTQPQANPDIQELFSHAYQLCNEGKELQAISCYREILKYAPNLVEALFNCAYLLRKMGLPAEAIPLYEKVLTLNPTHPYAPMGLGQVHLALENFQKGWELFEDRCKRPRPDVKKCAEYVRTHADLTGKKLLLKTEWGYGDTFMVLRYAKALKERGATIIIETPKELIPILSQQSYIDQTFVVNTPPPAFDFSTVTLSLPWTFNATENTIPKEPYLTADQKLVSAWREKLKHDTRFKIGIVWQGSCATHVIPLKLLTAITTLNNVSVYSLQKNASAELATIAIGTIKQFDADFDTTNGAFMDSAAVMKNLDLVITVDTASAHLAGALGVPTWLLLARASDWRWFLDREDSPWYPSMRLFRQPTWGDWETVITRVVQELQKITTSQQASANEAQPASSEKNFDVNAVFADGHKLVEQGHPEKALPYFERILEKRPSCPPVLYNIAGCYRRLGELEKAADYYHQVLTLEPKHTDAAFGLALVRHTQGDMKQGWELFNLWRTNIDTLPKNPEQLIGKKVLIKAEWGLGDMINFIRYAQNLHALGAHVTVQSHKALVKLLSRCPSIDAVIPHGSPLPTTDFQLPLLYLPTLFKTIEQTVPNTIPYLNPDPQLVTQWSKKFAHDTNFKVGICWDMGHYDTNLAGWKRAAPLEHWHNLLRVKNVSFYSLQKEQLEQLASLPTDIHVNQFDKDFDTTSGGFMDSAAVMKHLDLIISVDTSIAHLAGALGVPVWVMLPYHTDYRWMRDRTDTPWYPTMRLFRSPAPDDWNPVLEKVTRELRSLITTSRTKNTSPIAQTIITQKNIPHPSFDYTALGDSIDTVLQKKKN